ncbi:Phosphate transporter [Parasponia andersonii]|uniref:Phosphate transporter n=1 Tax=Parasponia andersonii TaxID=3476 RepID=A0A2P5E517_PARAD|nr:Phosphate transporter [Parasponia andersonii]
MSSLKNYENVSIDVVRKWQDTYQWIPIFGAFVAMFTAFLAGANNLPAPFSTPVGAGALTLFKAFIMSCLIYVPGAAFASNSINFLEERQPDAGFLMWSLVIVLVTAGTVLVTEGFGYIPIWNKKENHNFNGGGLVWILLEWTVAPLIACLFAFLLFRVLKTCVLRHENAEKRILVFLPIDYGVSAGLLCLFVVFRTVGAVSHQSSTCLELLMLDSPTVHVSLLSQNSLNSKQDRRGGGGYLQRLSDA